MADIRDKLENYAKSGVSFKSIRIVAGGNDASRPAEQIDLDASASALRGAITAAKTMATNVMLAAITPRTKPSHALENIHALNVSFQEISQEMSAAFVENDEHFYLKNGTVNEGYLYDAVHLTLKGANKLAETLGLTNTVNGQNVGVCSLKPVQPHCFEHKTLSSEVHDYSHTFWTAARSKASRDRQATKPAGKPDAYKRHPRGPPRQGAQPQHPQYAPRSQAHNPPASHNIGARPHHRAHHDPQQPQPMSHNGSSRPVHSRQHGPQQPQRPRGRHDRVLPYSMPSHPNHHHESRGPNKSGTFPQQPKPRSPKDNHAVTQRQGRNRDTVPDSIPRGSPFMAGITERSYADVMQQQYAANNIPSEQFDQYYCGLCGERNHRSWSCKHGMPIQCYTCHANGHKSKFCNAHHGNVLYA